MISKNKEWRDSFLEYCIKNPELRFFQALLAWSKLNLKEDIGYIYFGNSIDPLDCTDSFYLTPENKTDILK